MQYCATYKIEQVPNQHKAMVFFYVFLFDICDNKLDGVGLVDNIPSDN